jgi:hypothetical protein
MKIRFLSYLLLPLLAVTFAVAQTTGDYDNGGGADVPCPNPAIVNNLSRTGYYKNDTRTVPNGQVSSYQKFLKDYLNLSDQQFVVTGIFGNLTANFTKAFQREMGLPQTGSVFSFTRNKIQEVCADGGGDDTTPGSVDLKVNGSDGPVWLKAGDLINVSWTSNAPSCYLNNVRLYQGGNVEVIVPLSPNEVSGGSRSLFAPDGGNIQMTCTKPMSDRNVGVTDVVVVNYNRGENGSHTIQQTIPKPEYAIGEQVQVTVKATRRDGDVYSVAVPSEGYSVLVSVSYPEGAPITNFNPTYNPNTGYWEGSYSATYSGGAHVITSKLFCTNKDLPCGKYVTGTLDQILATSNATSIRVNGGGGGAVGVTASVYPQRAINNQSQVRVHYDVNNFPQGAAISIEVQGGAAGSISPIYPLVSPHKLDTGTRDVYTSNPDPTTFPQHGNVIWSPSIYSGSLPYNGPIVVKLTDSDGNIIAQTSVQFSLVSMPNPPSGVVINVTPSSGTAPLNVSGNYRVPITSNSYGSIDYGDGVRVNYPPGGTCTDDSRYNCFQIGHVYQSSGVYTIKILDNNNVAIGTALVTVSGSQSAVPCPTCTFSAINYGTNGVFLAVAPNLPYLNDAVSLANYVGQVFMPLSAGEQAKYKIDWGDGVVGSVPLQNSGVVCKDLSANCSMLDKALIITDNMGSSGHRYNGNGPFTIKLIQISTGQVVGQTTYSPGGGSNNDPSLNVSANPTSISSGQSSQLTITTTNVNTCTISGGEFGASVGVTTNGQKTVTPTQTSTYTISCVGTNGSSITKPVTVTVTPVASGTSPIKNLSFSYTPYTGYAEYTLGMNLGGWFEYSGVTADQVKSNLNYNFGDGTPTESAGLNLQCASTRCYFYLRHTYQNVGAYTLTVYYGSIVAGTVPVNVTEDPKSSSLTTTVPPGQSNPYINLAGTLYGSGVDAVCSAQHGVTIDWGSGNVHTGNTTIYTPSYGNGYQNPNSVQPNFACLKKRTSGGTLFYSLVFTDTLSTTPETFPYAGTLTVKDSQTGTVLRSGSWDYNRPGNVGVGSTDLWDSLIKILSTKNESTKIANVPGSKTVLGATAVCPTFTRSLARGDTGLDVLQLQQFLSYKKYLDDSNISGFYGDQTKIAVQELQYKRGVVKNLDGTNPGYGVVGAITQLEIAKMCKE